MPGRRRYSLAPVNPAAVLTRTLSLTARGLERPDTQAQTRRPSPGWHNVSSSNVRRVRYVGEGWLDVEFLKGKKTLYRYYDVPVRIFWQMLSAPSKGRFVHTDLKGKYDYSPL